MGRGGSPKEGGINILLWTGKEEITTGGLNREMDGRERYRREYWEGQQTLKII